MDILIMFGLVLLQNASFTLVSRARNSNSILYHGIASVLSNGIWLLVIRQVVLNFDKTELMLTYLVASVCGSIGMHYVAMKYFEKKKVKTAFDHFLDQVSFSLPTTTGRSFNKIEVAKINNALSNNYYFNHDEKINWFKYNVEPRILNG